MNNVGANSWTGSHNEGDAISASAAPIMTPSAAYQAALSSMIELQQGIVGYEERVTQVVQQINSLANMIESLRQHYNAVVDERDYIKRALEAAEGCTSNVQQLLHRYAAVNDPVVASDGYTYEREVITAYLNECQAMKNIPMSQQTGKELTMMLLPNRSFKRLLSQLLDVKQSDARGVGPSVDNNSSSGSPSRGGPCPTVAHGAAREEVGGKGTAVEPDSERLHPCVRVYGYCNYKDSCAYALYPYDACLSHLKGKCRFRSQCHERHVDFRGQMGQGEDSRGGSGGHLM
uniref:Putative RNA binding protein n=1 Tax=Trypanosoma congolense (strain IL3000) TaxID=1068625 RepID=G0UYN2_TRYCI|nr:putative RNA binding protein [Trypanosoma congolense IL3000]